MTGSGGLRDDVAPRRLASTRLDEVAGEVVLQAPGRARVVVDETARALWWLCDGVTTVDEMVQAVLDLFDVEPDRARAEVRQALETLLDLGVLEVSARGAGVSRR